MAKLELRFPDGLKETHELLQSRSLVIGSDETCDVRLFREGIQPKHAVIRWVDRRYHLDVDPLAKNIFVGVNPVTQLRLKPDAEFSIGDIECRIKYSADELGAVKPPSDDPWSTIASQQRQPPLYQSQSFLGIVTGLCILAILSVGLFFLVRARRADDLYASAQRDMNDALYAKAVVGFDEFLKAFPSDGRAPVATYLRAKARVEQYTEGSALSWPSAFLAAQKMMTEASSLPEFKKHPTEISDLVIKIAQGLAQQSRDKADAKLLDQSSQALAMLTKYLPAAAQRTSDLNRIQSLQQEARLSVTKAGFLDELLARMDESLAKERPLEVYRDFVELSHRYPDRVRDKRVRERLEKATEKEKALVSFSAPAANPAWRESSLVPSWTRYVRSAEIKEAGGEIIPITVADVLYGMDSKTGEVKWRRPIGSPTAFRPTRIGSDSDRMVAYRPETNDLLLIDAKTGLIRNGLSLGTMHPRLATDLTVAPGQLFIVATSEEKDSKGYILDITTEEDRLSWAGTYQFPQPILTAPAFDFERQSLMVIAEEGSLFAIDAKVHQVDSVVALGHEGGSVRHRPVMTGRFLFFDQFSGADSSLLRTFVISAKDGSLQESTPIPLKGHSAESPTIRGGRLFVATDRGEYSIFELGAETDLNPLNRAITYANLDATAGVPAFIRAINESDIWIFSGSASHFSVNIPRKELELLSNHPLPGPANRESSATDKDVWAVTANTKLSALSALRIGQTNEEIVVTTTLGTKPIASGTVAVDSAPKFIAVYPNSRDLISGPEIDKDTITEQIIPQLPNEVTNVGETLTVHDWPGGIVQVSAGKLLFAPATASKNEGMRTVKLTGNVGGLPVTCGSGILVPSEAGYIYWINPETGDELADPFAAPFENGQTLAMKAAVAVDSKDPSRGAIAAGGKTLFALKLSEGDAKAWQQTSKIELLGDAIIQQLAISGNIVWAIREKEIVAVDSRSLAIIGTIKTIPSSLPVLTTSDLLILTTGANQMLALHRSSDDKIATKWEKQLAATPIGVPIVYQDKLLTLLPDGTVLTYQLPDGVELPIQTFGRRMATGPAVIEQSLVGVAADGSVIRLPLP